MSEFPITCAIAALLTASALLPSCGKAPETEPPRRFVTVEGRVLDRADSLAVQQASVLFREVKMGAMTDTAGFYRVRNLPVGTYTIEVSSITHATRKREINIPAAPDTARLDFYLDRKLYDNFGHPIDPADTLGRPKGIQPQ